MRRLENLLIFHAQRGQVVGIKKSAIVDVIGGNSPVRQPESLYFDEFMQIVEARRVGRMAVDRLHGRMNSTGDLERSRTQFSQAALVDFFVPVSLRDELAA